MERESVSQGQVDMTQAEALSGDVETTHELTERGNQLLEVSKELTSSSKALLEELDPIV